MGEPEPRRCACGRCAGYWWDSLDQPMIRAEPGPSLGCACALVWPRCGGSFGRQTWPRVHRVPASRDGTQTHHRRMSSEDAQWCSEIISGHAGAQIESPAHDASPPCACLAWSIPRACFLTASPTACACSILDRPSPQWGKGRALTQRASRTARRRCSAPPECMPSTHADSASCRANRGRAAETRTREISQSTRPFASQTAPLQPCLSSRAWPLRCSRHAWPQQSPAQRGAQADQLCHEPAGFACLRPPPLLQPHCIAAVQLPPSAPPPVRPVLSNRRAM